MILSENWLSECGNCKWFGLNVCKQYNAIEVIIIVFTISTA